MRSVKLAIEGDWWDSYVYAGLLYLLRPDGTVVVAPWRPLVQRLAIGRRLDDLGLELAFLDARYLYGEQWARLVSDPEIGDVLTKKFERLADADLVLTQNDLRAVNAHTAGGLAPEALTDLEIHNNVVYFASEDGLRAVPRRRVTQPDSATSRLWDAEVFRVRAQGRVLALAAGSDGLFERHAEPRAAFVSDLIKHPEPHALVSGDFFSCGWVGSSIYATSYVNAGTLALFTEERDLRRRRTYRFFEDAIADDDLFAPDRLRDIELSVPETLATEPAEDQAGSDDSLDAEDQRVIFDRRVSEPIKAAEGDGGLSWGGYQLICQSVGNEVRVAHYQGRSRARRLNERLRFPPSLKLPEDAGAQDVIAGDVAPFGVVVESDRDLFVMSDAGVWRLGYEPARWRTFARATNYPNQLHVVADDRLEIHSFNTRMLSLLRSERKLLGRTRR